MSLTAHLESPDSPVRGFFLDRLPYTRQAVRQFVVREGRLGEPTVCPPDEVRAGYPWSTVGTAFDYRVRFLYTATPASSLVARYGAEWVARNDRKRAVPNAFAEIEAQLPLLLHAPLGRLLSAQDERWLAKACFVLALYEQCFRTMPNPDWPIIALGSTASAAEALGLCSEYIVDDLIALTELFVDSQRQLLSAKRAVLNPTFVGSAALGGADADLIIDNTLVELKTVKNAAPGRAELWQLVGYVLADLDDEHRIDTVALYFCRHGRLITWRLTELLPTLAGREVDVIELREAFENVLTEAAPRRARVEITRTSEPFPVVLVDAPPTPSTPPAVRRTLAFYGPVSGGRKWHARRAELPAFMHGGLPPDNLQGPACGANVALLVDADSFTPTIGTPYPEVDPRACRRCLGYTDSFYADYARYLEVNDGGDAIRRELAFRPSIDGRGKWHIAVGDVYAAPALWPERAREASCSSARALDFDAEPLTPSVGVALNDLDPRLCRACAKNTACWLPLADQAAEGI